MTNQTQTSLSIDRALFQIPGRQALAISPVFTPEWTIGAFVFAIVVCIVFGLYPARKASKLNPVEALRYE
jgi:putative ABC transport system permease protein